MHRAHSVLRDRTHSYNVTLCSMMVGCTPVHSQTKLLPGMLHDMVLVQRCSGHTLSGLLVLGYVTCSLVPL